MIIRQLLNWFRRGPLESDLDRELKYHVDRRVNDLMRLGLPEPEARGQAALEIGGLPQIREEVRDVWLSRWLRDFVYDLRFSIRSLVSSPSFAATVVLSLALGIGATTAMYSLVDQVVLHFLPVREPERLVLIDWNGYQATVNAFGSDSLMSYPLCRDLQQQTQFFEGVMCRASTIISVSTGREYTPAPAEIVSGTYFSVLGVRPAAGRLFNNDDDQAPGASPVVVLSYDFWKVQLAGAADIVGRKVLVNRHPMTVIGIAGPDFRGIDVGEVPSLWIPAAMSAQAIPGFDDMQNRFVRWVQILGRLRNGVTLAQTQAGLQPWFKAVLEEDARREGFPKIRPDERRQFLASTLELTPAPQGHSQLRRMLWQPLLVLLGATAALLGLACLNVAGLFLARGSARSREIQTRLALGASRGRIGRQLLADSLLIAVGGGLLGIVLAPPLMRALIAFLPQHDAPNALQATLNTRLLLFAFVISIAAGILSGIAPALQAGRVSVIASLKQRAGAAFGSLRLRRIIVAAQIALTLILVIGAALFVRTLTSLLAKGPGFDTSRLISFGIDPGQNGYAPAEAARIVHRIHDRLRALPATQASAIAYNALLTGGSWNDRMTIETDRRITTDRSVRLNAVSPEFFSTLGVRIIAGRDFVERDTLPVRDGGQAVAIVNESFVRRYFNGRSPLGVRIGFGPPNVKPDIEIVGVMPNISYRDVREEREQAYFPITNGAEAVGGEVPGNFYVRIQGSPEAALQSIRTIVRNEDPTLPISYFRTVNEQVSRSLTTERMLAALSSSFGTLALLLSLVGLYGVISFTVTQRTQEIGVRLALGATRLATLWLVLRDALVMTAIGIAIALPSVWALGRFVETQLYGIKAMDPATIATATIILCSAVLGASLLPAHRALRVNPTDALRLE